MRDINMFKQVRYDLGILIQFSPKLLKYIIIITSQPLFRIMGIIVLLKYPADVKWMLSESKNLKRRDRSLDLMSSFPIKIYFNGVYYCHLPQSSRFRQLNLHLLHFLPRLLFQPYSTNINELFTIYILISLLFFLLAVDK